MGGLKRLCRMYGRMVLIDSSGNEVVWVWDYVQEKARKEKEMTKKEWRASEKAKQELIKKQLDNEQ